MHYEDKSEGLSLENREFFGPCEMALAPLTFPCNSFARIKTFTHRAVEIIGAEVVIFMRMSISRVHISVLGTV